MRKNRTRAVSDSGIQYIGSASDTVASGNFSVDISGLSHGTGDLGILIVSCVIDDSTPGITGWTEVNNEAVLGNLTQTTYRRTMNSADTTVASTTGGDYVSLVASVHIFRNVSTSAPSWVTDSGLGQAPDSPNSAAISGSEGVIISAGSTADSDWTSATAPSGYTEMTNVDRGASSYVHHFMTYKIVTAQENPGAFGGSHSGTHIGTTITIQED